jgi:flagellar biosynthesis component FlhA
VRTGLKRAICNKFINDDNKMYVLRFDPNIENEVYKNISLREDGSVILTLKPDSLHKIQNAVKAKVTEMFESGYPPVILCQAPVRRAISEIAKFINRNIAVLSTKEIVSNIEVVLYGQITLEEKVTT